MLVHGEEGFFGYTVDGACSKGANTTVEVIARTLQKLSQLPKRQQAWPSVLFIQLDGCVGDNKNRTVFGYCAWLVAQGHFKEVHVNFLLVGHTHEDIDAVFGIISKFFKACQRAMITLKELATAVYEALTRVTHNFNATQPVEHVRSTHDWSSFILGSTEDPNLAQFGYFAKQVPTTPDTHRPFKCSRALGCLMLSLRFLSVYLTGGSLELPSATLAPLPTSQTPSMCYCPRVTLSMTSVLCVGSGHTQTAQLYFQQDRW